MRSHTATILSPNRIEEILWSDVEQIKSANEALKERLHPPKTSTEILANLIMIPSSGVSSRRRRVGPVDATLSQRAEEQYKNRRLFERNETFSALLELEYLSILPILNKIYFESSLSKVDILANVPKVHAYTARSHDLDTICKVFVSYLNSTDVKRNVNKEIAYIFTQINNSLRRIRTCDWATYSFVNPQEQILLYQFLRSYLRAMLLYVITHSNIIIRNKGGSFATYNELIINTQKILMSIIVLEENIQGRCSPIGIRILKKGKKIY